MNTSELTGAALDWAVAKCEGESVRLYAPNRCGGNQWMILAEDTSASSCGGGKWCHYSTDWSQGGPLLNQYRISRTIGHSGLWIAYAGFNLNDEHRHMQCDRSELVAGLRCLVALNLGDKVEIPEEFQRNRNENQ